MFILKSFTKIYKTSILRKNVYVLTYCKLCWFFLKMVITYMMGVVFMKDYFIFILLFFFPFPFLLFSLNHLKSLTGRVENWGKIVISFYKWICDYLSTSYVYLGKDLRTGEALECFSVDKLEDLRNVFTSWDL